MIQVNNNNVMLMCLLAQERRKNMKNHRLVTSTIDFVSASLSFFTTLYVLTHDEDCTEPVE